MNEFMQFMFFSTLEYFAVIFIALSLWGFSTKKIFKIICLSVIFSSISYEFREFKLDGLSPIYTILYTMIILHLFYRSKFLYSFLISLSGYIIAAFVQVACVVIFLLCTNITIAEMGPFTMMGSALQTATFMIVVVLSIKIKANKYIISFIPEEKYRLQKPVFTNKILLLLSIFIVSFLVASFYLVINFDANVMIYVFLFIITLSISTLLFFLYKRDSEEFAHLQ